MYKKVGLTENSLRILALFTKGYDRDLYIREIHQLLNISPRTSQLILEDLEKKGVLESRTRGRIKTYTIRKNSTAMRYMILAEQYKAISFLESNILIREAVDNLTPLIDGAGTIFGSYAKAKQTRASDLDILILGRCKNAGNISKRLGIDISIKQYPTLPAMDDILLREVIKDHIVFLDAEGFVSRVLNYTSWPGARRKV